MGHWIPKSGVLGRLAFLQATSPARQAKRIFGAKASISRPQATSNMDRAPRTASREKRRQSVFEPERFHAANCGFCEAERRPGSIGSSQRLLRPVLAIG